MHVARKPRCNHKKPQVNGNQPQTTSAPMQVGEPVKVNLADSSKTSQTSTSRQNQGFRPQEREKRLARSNSGVRKSKTGQRQGFAMNNSAKGATSHSVNRFASLSNLQENGSNPVAQNSSDNRSSSPGFGDLAITMGDPVLHQVDTANAGELS